MMINPIFIKIALTICGSCALFAYWKYSYKPFLDKRCRPLEQAGIIPI